MVHAEENTPCLKLQHNRLPQGPEEGIEEMQLSRAIPLGEFTRSLVTKLFACWRADYRAEPLSWHHHPQTQQQKWGWSYLEVTTPPPLKTDEARKSQLTWCLRWYCLDTWPPALNTGGEQFPGKMTELQMPHLLRRFVLINSRIIGSDSVNSAGRQCFFPVHHFNRFCVKGNSPYTISQAINLTLVTFWHELLWQAWQVIPHPL